MVEFSSNFSYLDLFPPDEEENEEQLIRSFPPSRSWELAETIELQRTVDWDEVEKRQQSVPYIPPVTFTGITKTSINDDPVVGGKRYLVHESPIGKGGLSVVFKALDRRLMRRIAIKCLQDDAYEEITVQAMEKEAKVMAHINHPNILNVYEFMHIPKTPDSRATGQKGSIPAILMEYMDPDFNVGSILQRRRLAPREASTMVTQIAGALDYMAERQIFHRDLKPTNFFWDGYQVKVADFGLASTVMSDVFGTGSFISPEQITDSETVTLQSEVFSLASNVFYFLTRKIRFEDEVRGSTPIELLQATLDNNGFTDPGKIAMIRDALAGTGVDYQNVVAVLHTAQLKHMVDRYKTASEFASALEEALTPGPSIRIIGPAREQDLPRINDILEPERANDHPTKVSIPTHRFRDPDPTVVPRFSRTWLRRMRK